MTDNQSTRFGAAEERRIHAINLAVAGQRDRVRFDRSKDPADFAAENINDAAAYEAYLRDGTVPPRPVTTPGDDTR